MVELTASLGGVIGGRSATAVKDAFDYSTVEALLRHFPRRYVNAAQIDSFAEMKLGDFVTFAAQVVDVRNFRYAGKKWRTEMIVTDGSSTLSATFFGQPFLEKAVPVGSWQLLSGRVGEFNGKAQLKQPVRRTVEGDHTAKSIIPIYAATSKVASWDIERMIDTVLDVLDDDLPDPLPASLGLMGLRDAFERIHRPQTDNERFAANHRFKVEEAFIAQTVFAVRRHALDAETAVARPSRDGGLRARFEERLPFELTAGQREVVSEISADISRARPMHRLLQGDVGSGKTIVALLAMLQVVDAGGQCALLAPTEVLAVQHHRGITDLLGDLAASGMLGGAEGATRVRLLTGAMGTKARKEALLDIMTGEAGIVIGTHALLQDSVQFAELGLLVVDEQHRFGVEQRALLVDRSDVAPHVLVMTATPIPRTVAMTVFGDLETSTLRELPWGRKPVQTTVVALDEHPGWLDRAWERIVEEVGRGRQAYIVASRIGDSDPEAGEGTAATTSAQELHGWLSAGPLANLRLGLLHGRLPTDEKDEVMSQFAAGDLDVLVATTVIEVGVDVPNATMMVIMDADRFGVSQLHQLRGRVGRGGHEGLCLLVTAASADSASRERLTAVASTTDGFALAKLDIELRREGDVLGAKQSGTGKRLKVLSVVRDEKIIVEARRQAAALVADDPELTRHRALADAVHTMETSDGAEFLERA